MNQTLFYVLGIALVVSAIALFAIGTLSEKFPSTPVLAVAMVFFAALVVATATYAVLNSQDEQADRRAKLAEEEKKFGSAPAPGGGTVPKPDLVEITAAGSSQGTPVEGSSGQQGEAKQPKQPKVKGPGGKLSVAADQTQLAFDKKSLTSKPGKVTIDLDNPAAIPHDIAVQKGNDLLAESEQ